MLISSSDTWEMRTTLALIFIAVVGVSADLTTKEKKELKCAVCRAVVFEVNQKILAVGPKKMIDVGNYRIDGDGNQGTKAVSYARSETHLVEIMENICDQVNNYGQTTLKNGRASLTSMTARDGISLHVKNLALSPDKSKIVKHMCSVAISDYDDDMIEIYTDTTLPLDDMELSICSEKLTGYCGADDLEVPFPHNDEDVMETSRGNEAENDEEATSSPPESSVDDVGDNDKETSNDDDQDRQKTDREDL